MVSNSLLLAGALCVDIALGDPKFFPHPVAGMGKAIDWFDRNANNGRSRRLKGGMSLLFLCLTALFIGSFVEAFLLKFSFFGPVILMLFMGWLLAARSLYDHVLAVGNALRIDISRARTEIAQICGRDPESLDESAIARAAIESLAESFCDGIIAPLFWGLLFGLPGILVYKLVNTADSMIGHKNAKYAEFGWTAARLDDCLNWVPARITALLIAVSASVSNHSRFADIWRITWREASNHASPNAGWPETAMAASLGLALGGPRTYDGEKTNDAWLNETGRTAAGREDIAKALEIFRYAWVCTAILLLLQSMI